MTPEESIIKQGDEGCEIYYIMQGDCTVDLTEFNGNEIKAMGLLVEGDHFGEISFFYKCPITCTITSRNYNSMARLQFANLKMLLREYPGFKQYL